MDAVDGERQRMQLWDWEQESDNSESSVNWHFHDEDQADESTNSEPDLTDAHNYRVGAFTFAPPPPPPPAPHHSDALDVDMLALADSLDGGLSNFDCALARAGLRVGSEGDLDKEQRTTIRSDQNSSDNNNSANFCEDSSTYSLRTEFLTLVLGMLCVSVITKGTSAA